MPEEEVEKPLESPEWGGDVMITSGRAYDISMDVNRNGEIFIAVDSGTKDICIYLQINRWWIDLEPNGDLFRATTRTFEQIELMCFDRPEWN